MYSQKAHRVGLSVLMHSIKFFFVIQETVCKFQSLLVNFIHTIVKTFSKFTKELHKNHMDTCFVVLLNLVLMKFIIARTFFRMDIHPLCTNFNFTIQLGSVRFRSRIRSRIRSRVRSRIRSRIHSRICSRIR